MQNHSKMIPCRKRKASDAQRQTIGCKNRNAHNQGINEANENEANTHTAQPTLEEATPPSPILKATPKRLNKDSMGSAMHPESQLGKFTRIYLSHG